MPPNMVTDQAYIDFAFHQPPLSQNQYILGSQSARSSATSNAVAEQAYSTSVTPTPPLVENQQLVGSHPSQASSNPSRESTDNQGSTNTSPLRPLQRKRTRCCLLCGQAGHHRGQKAKCAKINPALRVANHLQGATAAEGQTTSEPQTAHESHMPPIAHATAAIDSSGSSNGLLEMPDLDQQWEPEWFLDGNEVPAPTVEEMAFWFETGC